MGLLLAVLLRRVPIALLLWVALNTVPVTLLLGRVALLLRRKAGARALLRVALLRVALLRIALLRVTLTCKGLNGTQRQCEHSRSSMRGYARAGPQGLARTLVAVTLLRVALLRVALLRVALLLLRIALL